MSRYKNPHQQPRQVREAYVEQLSYGRGLTAYTNTKRKPFTHLNSANSDDFAYLSTPDYLRQFAPPPPAQPAEIMLMGSIKRTKSASEMALQHNVNPQNIGNPKYKAQEDYYDEVHALKKELKAIKEENSSFRAKIRRLEEDNNRKRKEIESVYDLNKDSDLRRTLGGSSTDRNNNSTASIVISLKQRIFRLESQLKEKEGIIDELKSDPRFTRSIELEAQNRALYSEIQRQKLEKSNYLNGHDYSSTLNDESKNLIRTLTDTNNNLKKENASLKKKLESDLNVVYEDKPLSHSLDIDDEKNMKEMENLKKENEKLAKRLEQMEDLANKHDMLTMKVKSMEDLEKKDTENKEKIEELEKQLEFHKKKQQEMRNVSTELQKKQEEYDQLREKIQRMDENLEKSNRENRRLLDENESLKRAKINPTQYSISQSSSHATIRSPPLARKADEQPKTHLIKTDRRGSSSSDNSSRSSSKSTNLNKSITSNTLSSNVVQQKKPSDIQRDEKPNTIQKDSTTVIDSSKELPIKQIQAAARGLLNRSDTSKEPDAKPVPKPRSSSAKDKVSLHDDHGSDDDMPAITKNEKPNKPLDRTKSNSRESLTDNMSTPKRTLTDSNRNTPRSTGGPHTKTDSVGDMPSFKQKFIPANQGRPGSPFSSRRPASPNPSGMSSIKPSPISRLDSPKLPSGPKQPSTVVGENTDDDDDVVT